MLFEVKVENSAGQSLRRRPITTALGLEYQYQTAVTHVEKDPQTSVTNTMWKDSTGPMEATRIKFANAGNYPFVWFSPDIDYALDISFTRRCGSKDISVAFTLTHDAFPDYEVIVDGKVSSFPTKDDGPSVSNLGGVQDNRDEGSVELHE